MAVTMGETAADYLNVQLGLGLALTSLLMTVVLIAALVWQFAQKRYVPAPYWLAVVLISVVGTLITDNLVDNLHVPLQVTTAVFAVLLADHLRGLVSGRNARCRSTRSSRPGARPSTGSRSSSPSRSAPRPAISSPSSSRSGYLATGILFGMIIASLSDRLFLPWA